MTKKQSMSRDRLVEYLDRYLNIATIEDDSPNGLQVEGNARVSKIAFAVDASVTTIRAAARAKADLLIVHHGLFWRRHQQIVGSLYKRVSLLVRNDLSLYAVHLPLDCHPELGNNVVLARLFGMEVIGQFGEYKGTKIGLLALLPDALPRGDLEGIVGAKLGAPVDTLPFGPAKVRRVGVISGGAAMFAEEAKRRGCDTLITGESSHASYHLARDAGINVMFAGHYATETVGIRALERHLRERFGVPGKFIPAPTGY